MRRNQREGRAGEGCPGGDGLENSGVRLNKWLSAAGVCSRREADRLIAEGKVLVEGRRAVTGQRICPGQAVLCDGKPVSGGGISGESAAGPVLLAVNKPRGIVCTTSDKDRAENIVEFLHYPTRIYPIGRLDKESEGLLLMTNQGELVNRILRGRYGHEKEYLVTVDRPLTEEFLRRMRGGVEILDTVTRPCEVKRAAGKCTFDIVLTQGLNRQIRRMCEVLGYRVMKLKRIRIMNIELGNLKTGKYRDVTGDEMEELNRLLGRAQERQIGSREV